jgi:sigma-B regulation protein RsbU (phosphoserine phosphatase)
MMGHGISSSLVCMFISSVMRDTIKELADPELVIKELNRYMALLHNPGNDHNYYFTGIYLLIDTRQKTIEYVNAGHPEGYVLVDNNALLPIERGSYAVGFFDKIEVKKSVIHYENNMQVLLFTDGVLEALGSDEDVMLNKLQLLASQKWSNIRSPIHLVIPEEHHSGQGDDMCILMIQAK